MMGAMGAAMALKGKMGKKKASAKKKGSLRGSLAKGFGSKRASAARKKARVAGARKKARIAGARTQARTTSARKAASKKRMSRMRRARVGYGR